MYTKFFLFLKSEFDTTFPYERISITIKSISPNFIFFFIEPQVRSICNHVRPDRQTLLFSATFKKKVEKLARDVLTDPIRIVQGDVGEANTDVTQHVIMFHNNPSGKWNWLLQNLVEFLSAGSLLIFVTKKVRKLSTL